MCVTGLRAADYREAGRQEAFAREVVQSRNKFSLGQITRSAENDHGAGFGRPGEPNTFPQWIGQQSSFSHRIRLRLENLTGSTQPTLSGAGAASLFDRILEEAN